MAGTKLLLLRTLEELRKEEFLKFKWFLSQKGALEGYPALPYGLLEDADRMNIVDQMVQTFCINSVKVTQILLKNIGRNDLMERLLQNVSGPEDILRMCLRDHKSQLKQKFRNVSDGAAKQIPLDKIYTEIFIVEGGACRVNEEHEVRQMETSSRKKLKPEKNIKPEDIFKPAEDGPIRSVMTKGVAGIGKTFLTQKFTLDWAEGRSDSGILFTFPLAFRELNVLKGRTFSLVGLIHHFFEGIKKAGICRFETYRVLFILDGLDECRPPLDFSNTAILTDPTEPSSLAMLMVNLIRGNLLPSAQLWITTRPAAANQIPPHCVAMMTEVRGFTDAQKEKYFKMRFPNKTQAEKIISHVKSSRSIHIMCHIPVFCWITAKVLMDEMRIRRELPRTLTEMYIHFLVVQTRVKEVKYYKGAVKNPDLRRVVESLGRLAYEQLQKGNLIFYESDLKESGIDIREASLYSGIFTEIFTVERDMYETVVYSFVHLSVQEFLAAVYLSLCHASKRTQVIQDFLGNDPQEDEDIWALDVFLDKAVRKSVESRNGRLDLLLRFLHGLSLESNRRLLAGLLGRPEVQPETIQRILDNLKHIGGEEDHADRVMNGFHCLMEMNDSSAHKSIQKFLNSNDRSINRLSYIQCSALAYMLQMSDEVLEEMDFERNRMTVGQMNRLLTAVRNCRRLRCDYCYFPDHHCDVICSAMMSDPSHLVEISLRYAHLSNSGVKLLLSGLESSHCRLEVLRLVIWGSDRVEHSKILTRALESHMKKTSHLKVLKLSGYKLHRTDFLESPNCQLETLSCCSADLSETSCEVLARALISNLSGLKKLDLSYNDLNDLLMEILCGGLQNPNCNLESLSLSSSCLSSTSCVFLVSALRSNPAHLRHLDLSHNNLHDEGVKILSAVLKDQRCKIKSLWLMSCELTGRGCEALARALRSSCSSLVELDLTYNKLKQPDMKQLSELKDSGSFKLTTLRYKTPDYDPGKRESIFT